MSIILLAGHLIGVALGVGGATMSDVLFLMSISDNKLDRSEFKLIKMSSKIVMIGLILLYLSGIGFILSGNETNPRFFAKMSVVLIVTLNGLFVHQYLFPFLEKCVEHNWDMLSEKVLPYVPLFASAGVVSAVSWYTALIFGLWRSLSLSYIQLVGAYISILLVGIILINFVLLLLLYNPKILSRMTNSPAEH